MRGRPSRSAVTRMRNPLVAAGIGPRIASALRISSCIFVFFRFSVSGQNPVSRRSLRDKNLLFSMTPAHSRAGVIILSGVTPERMSEKNDARKCVECFKMHFL
ncbi:hypothetical protein Y032_0182g884 [Ancylostoma ceylanicum]|uniref:Uncharacterized protein n=1 Tax=Ancylostoma ceylanicum TaxID=53326 RepID=A0A016SSP2_9BILA|nr:hypothetical protein Y032_0182g884 [Ancylostoma ceylanicum]